MFTRTRKLAPLLLSLVFFGAGAIDDGMHRTLTAPTILFGVCAAMLLARAPLARRVRPRPLQVQRPGEMPQGLACSATGIRYADRRGKEHHLAWDDIQRVSWSEPDWGYLESEPYWTLHGQRRGIEVEGAWSTAARDPLPQWFAKALPGFDAAVVDQARQAGYFKTPSMETLVCWTRPGGPPRPRAAA